jgi:hypothetical protein
MRFLILLGATARFGRQSGVTTLGFDCGWARRHGCEHPRSTRSSANPARSLMVERNFGWVLGYFAAGLFFSPLIAFFRKRGFASTNKAGQQHYVIPDAP